MRIEFLNVGRDYTYANVGPAGWSLGEICAGIVCACLPTLRPLLFRVVPASRSIPRIKFSKYIVQSDGKQKLSSRVSAEERGGEESAGSYAMESQIKINKMADVEAGKSTESLNRPQVFRNVM